LSDRMEALVSDFGLAKPVGDKGFAAPDLFYSKMVPPEVFHTIDFTLAYDIFQFGLTLYRMCNGDDAFNHQFLSYSGADGNLDADRFGDDVANGRFPNRVAFPPHIPQGLRKIVRRCLEVSPSNRYRSALHIANDLATLDGKIIDWHHAIDASGRTWRKSDGHTMYVLNVSLDGRSELRKTVAAGAAKRVIDGCQATINDREIARILGSY